MSKGSDDDMIMSLREWRQAIRTPPAYRVGNSTLRVRTQFVCIMITLALLVFLILFTYHSSPSTHNYAETFSKTPMKSLNTELSIPFSNFFYNDTYPLSPSLKTPAGVKHRIGIISDLDTDSKSAKESDTWTSIYRKGYLTWNPVTNGVSVEWDAVEPTVLKSKLGLGGRGMELSELIVFNAKLLAFDDRTGVVYELIKDKPVPWLILADGDGKVTKGFKTEWAAVKGQTLYIGGLGKEWTTPTGELVNHDPQWIKTVSPSGQVSHVDWHDNYLKLRKVLGIDFPGYMIHEACAWSEVHKRWFFLPRRASKQRYDEVKDETNGANVMLTTDQDFSSVQMTTVGELIPTHGFSSFKFVPGSDDNVIVALKTEENKGVTATYIMAFDIKGKILMPETKIASMKYEGIEFI